MLYMIKDGEGMVHGENPRLFGELTKWLIMLLFTFKAGDGSLYLLPFNCTRLSERSHLSTDGIS